jgi:hypothetical protein
VLLLQLLIFGVYVVRVRGAEMFFFVDLGKTFPGFAVIQFELTSSYFGPCSEIIGPASQHFVELASQYPPLD